MFRILTFGSIELGFGTALVLAPPAWIRKFSTGPFLVPGGGLGRGRQHAVTAHSARSACQQQISRRAPCPAMPPLPSPLWMETGIWSGSGLPRFLFNLSTSFTLPLDLLSLSTTSFFSFCALNLDLSKLNVKWETWMRPMAAIRLQLGPENL